MTTTGDRSFRISEENERRLVVDLPDIIAMPENFTPLLIQFVKHLTIVFGITAVLITAYTYWGGTQAVISIAFVVALFFFNSLCQAWEYARLIAICHYGGPQTVTVTSKHLVQRTGSSWMVLTVRIALNKLRGIQPIDETLKSPARASEDEEDEAEVIDPVYHFSVVAIQSDFQPFLITSELDQPAAEELAQVISEACNEKLGHTIQTEADRINAPVRLGRSGESADDIWANEVTRVPPGSKAKIDIDELGVIRVTMPNSLSRRYLNGWTSAAITIGIGLVPAWVIFFNLAAGFNLYLGLLLLVTAIWSFMVYKSYAHRHGVTVVVADGEKLTFTEGVKNKLPSILYSQIDSIEYEHQSKINDTTQITIRYGNKNRRSLFVGYRDEELIWLCALLRWAVGLGNDSAD